MEPYRDHLLKHGQAHLVAHAETLPQDEQEAFLAAAAGHPWAELRTAVSAPEVGVSPSLRPPQALRWKRQVGEGGLRARLAKLGLGLLRGGRVATCLLAGGQGTRLGHDGPKGTFAWGEDPDRTLYRVFGERVAAASRLVGRPIPLYVLVSEATEAATRHAFEAASSWGLAEGQVRWVVQGMLPALDDEGRGLLAGPGQLALAPDGHGGVLTALQRHGVLAALETEGVDVLTTFQVDNPLGRPLDPVMLGWMVERRLQVITKTVAKATPEERVGVVARMVSGRHRIVEYSELPEEGTEDLVQGSIAVHGFSVRWLRACLSSDAVLPLHRARKKVPCLDAEGVLRDPVAPNAWKLERFLFDVFPHAERLEVHEVRREQEFAPIKNPTGVDSAVSARLLVDAEVLRWHAERGLPAPASPVLDPLHLDGADPWTWAAP